MKNVKSLSLGTAMLFCLNIIAQEKTASENNLKSKDTVKNEKGFANVTQPATTSNRIVICATSRSLINEPLYILDDTPIISQQFSKVNPNDIQEVKILKGNEATSIYGNRGINGVIIITTKKKRSQDNNEE